MDASWSDKPPEELLFIVSGFIETTFNEGTATKLEKITIPAINEKKQWLNVLKDTTFKSEGKFTDAGALPLLSKMYTMLRLSKCALSKFASQNRSLQTEISTLKKKKMNTPDNVDGLGLQQIMRKELETFQTNLVEDLNTKMNHTKNLTEKKWSDLFKSNKDDLKDQKKQANMKRKTLEKTIADNKRQTLVDNLERQKRASNICVSNVAESIKTDKNAKDKEDRDTIIDILQMKESDVKHVFRAGAVEDKPRPLIIVLASPELARTKHDYGKGRPIRDKEGRNILYWINPDLIKADRFANYKARLAKP